MSGLVNLQAKSPQWAKPSDHIFIGKDILELLSTSMYVDPLTMYREYIQNAADARDAHALATGSRKPGAVSINIDRQERTIVITDDGPGLDEREFHIKLSSIGGSSKRGTDARGFRGVGRLAGLAYCQELIFRTRPVGKNAVHELRWDARKVRTLLRSADTRLDLAGIIADSIDLRTLPAVGVPEHFFQVELRNVVRHRDDRLLNSLDVSQYLGQVAPVDFHPEFEFGAAIREFLHRHGAGDVPLALEVEGEGPVYRPHRSSLLIGSKTINLLPPETIVTLDREGQPSGATWIAHHEYLGSLPKSTMVSGWRLRSGDVQVGGNDILEDLFPESRFNGWTIAETHVLSKKIVPNGRRDNYEHGAHLSDLLTRLTPTAKDIAHRCRMSSVSRNALQRHEAELARCEANIAIASKPRTPAFVVSSLRQEITTSLSSLERASQRGLFSDSDGDNFQLRVKKISNRLKAIPENPDASDALKDFQPAQRRLLKEVIETIYLSEVESGLADRLIGRILSRLRRRRQKP